MNGSPVSLTVDNLGGIDHVDLTLEPGVTIFSGQNATNRTSLLAALGGVLGGSTASLKSDAENGYVEIELNNNTFRREYSRTSTGVQISGTPYSEKEALVDLCVTLFENNPARQAVERGTDLREIILRPVDTDAIEARIAELKQRRQEVDDKIQQIEEQRSKLPGLEQEREEAKEEIATLNEELDQLQSEVAEHEADLEAAEEAADVVDKLNARRQELSSLEDQIEVKEAELEALHEDIESIRADFEELPESAAEKLATIEENLNAAQRQKHELDDTIASLTTIIDFNDELLSEGTGLPGIDTESTDVAAGLAPEEEQEVVCWTCGSHVQRKEIGNRLDDLRDVVEEKRQRREELQERIDELQDDKHELETIKSERTSLERRLAELQEKVDDRKREIEHLRSNHDDLEDEIEELEHQVAETEELRETDLLDKYERISQLQYEQGQLQQQLDDLTEEVDEIESLPTKEELESQRAKIQSELEAERSRVAEVETEAIEAFNEHMDQLLDILDYKNIARVWIEKKQESGSRRTSTENATFDLHIVRETAEGTGYEDRVENLSESEREVIGLVVALAGYLVHDVHEKVPFMLLDSMEAIDAQRIADLIDYFSRHVSYLIIALLPEDAAAMEGEYDQISADVLAT